MALQLLKDGKTFAEINSDEPKICFLHGPVTPRASLRDR